jgi:hypothetical protein
VTCDLARGTHPTAWHAPALWPVLSTNTPQLGRSILCDHAVCRCSAAGQALMRLQVRQPERLHPTYQPNKWGHGADHPHPYVAQVLELLLPGTLPAVDSTLHAADGQMQVSLPNAGELVQGPAATRGRG